MMSIANTGRVILLICCGLAGAYYLQYWYHNKNRVSRAASFLLLCGVGLLILSNAAAVPQPTTLLLRMITVGTFHQGVLFIYFALDQFTKEDVQQIYKTRLYLGTVAVHHFQCPPPVKLTCSERGHICHLVSSALRP